jgi:hypothetical protein
MTQQSRREPDRRRHLRIEAKASITLRALGNVHLGRLVNIGAGGLYVATEITEPERLLGRVVELELRFDGSVGSIRMASPSCSRHRGSQRCCA